MRTAGGAVCCSFLVPKSDEIEGDETGAEKESISVICDTMGDLIRKVAN